MQPDEKEHPAPLHSCLFFRRNGEAYIALKDLHGIFLKPTTVLTDRYLSCRAATALGTQPASVIGREHENSMVSISTVERVLALLQTSFRPHPNQVRETFGKIETTPYSSVDILVLGI